MSYNLSSNTEELVDNISYRNDISTSVVLQTILNFGESEVKRRLPPYL